VNGLSGAPREEQTRILKAYPNLYHRGDDGIVRLSIRSGGIALQDLETVGFGSASEFP
jgi:hypothetical protein